jgi:glycerol-3-phosphate dehydrogenase
MIRDVARLGAQTFDVLVIGGTPCGLAIAYDAALRGLSVALIDRDDFGSGRSFGYLPTLDVRCPQFSVVSPAAAREWMSERRTLARIVPYAIRPVAVVLPLYRSVLGGKLATRIRLLSDSLLAFDRNRDVPQLLSLPSPEILSRGEAAERYPGLRRQGLTGAAVWHEYLATEPDRLTVVWALAAARQAAVLANHVEITAVRRDAARVVAVDVEDRLNGASTGVSARIVVDATGGAALPSLGVTPLPSSNVVSLVIPRDAADDVLGGRGQSGQRLFLVPFRGGALVSGWEWPAGGQEKGAVTQADLQRWVADANHAFPTLDLRPDHVTRIHVERVPSRSPGGSAVAIRDHAKDGIEGLISVTSAHDLTARAVAERVTDLVARRLGRPPSRCRTAFVPLPGGDFGDATSLVARVRRDFDAAFPSDTIPHLVAAYGSECRDVLSLAGSRSEWHARIDERSAAIGGELIWAARHEMAVTLEDALVRRTPLSAVALPDESALGRAANVLGDELGWSADRRQREIATLRTAYGTSNALKT